MSANKRPNNLSCHKNQEEKIEKICYGYAGKSHMTIKMNILEYADKMATVA